MDMFKVSGFLYMSDPPHGMLILDLNAGGNPTPTPSGPTAPVISQTSTTGANPFLWTVAENASFFDGYYWEVQTATGANAAAAAIALAAGTTTADIIQEIVAGDLTGPGPITIAGLNTTSLPGPIALRVRVGVDDGAGGYTWGPWSNILTDTLAATSTAELAPSNGVNKNQYIDTTGSPKKLTAVMNNVIGATCCAGATLNTLGKFHCEWTIDALGALLEFGIRDAAFAIGPAVFSPACGSGSVAGCSVRFALSSNLFTLNANGSAVSMSCPVPVAGDIIALDGDTTANTLRWTHHSGTTNTVLTTATLTSNQPTNWNGYGGGASNAGAGDGYSWNPGNTLPFAVTPQSGHGIYA